MDVNPWNWISGSMCDCAGPIARVGWPNKLKLSVWLIHANRVDLLSQKEATIICETKDFSRVFSLVEQNCGAPVLLYGCENIFEDQPESSYLPLLTYLFSLYCVLHNSPKDLACPERKNIGAVLPEMKFPNFRRILSDGALLCDQCGEPVKIFERFIVNSHVRHRKCFSCIKCQKLLYIGLYKCSTAGQKCDEKGDKSGTVAFECLEHEKEQFLAKFTPKAEEISVENLANSQPPENCSKIDEHEKKSDNGQQCEENLQENEILWKRVENNVRLEDFVCEKGAALQRENVDVKSADIAQYDGTEDSNFIQKKIDADLPKPPPRIKKKLLNAMRPVSEFDSNSAGGSSPRLEGGYPEDLNPFESDSAEMLESSRSFADSMNPFLLGDDDELSVTSSVSSWNICDESNSDPLPEFSIKNSGGAPNLSAYLLPCDSRSASSLSVGRHGGVCADRSPVTRLSEAQPATVVDACRSSPSPSPSSTAGGKKRVAPRPPLEAVDFYVGGSNSDQPSQESRKSQVSATTEVGSKFQVIDPKSPTKMGAETSRKKRLAPPPPLPLRRQIAYDSTLDMENILKNLNSINEEFCELEKRGCELELKITENFSSGIIGDADQAKAQAMLQRWFGLCHEKMNLLQKQSEFAFLYVTEKKKFHAF